MADDLRSNLSNYKLQLEQVEAALTTDPENKELHKLKEDLEEVIKLTCDLIKTQFQDTKSLADPAAGTSTLVPDSVEELPVLAVKKNWKVGDRCLAMWSEDGQYYEATIEDITEDGEEVSVVFDNYNNSDVTTLSLLRDYKPGHKAPLNREKRQELSKQREYQKKKKQKKLQRYKQLEEERETEKNKWLAFKYNTKGSKKGMIKKSIFASPDNVTGRVGIGTCGTSGKPMTEFATSDKRHKRMT